jgi:hypothetical protein
VLLRAACTTDMLFISFVGPSSGVSELAGKHIEIAVCLLLSFNFLFGDTHTHTHTRLVFCMKEEGTLDWRKFL